MSPLESSETPTFSPELEQAIKNYPQIDFRKILSEKEQSVLLLKGLSGATLKASFKPERWIKIEDSHSPKKFYLVAGHRSGIVEFSYQTRIRDPKTRDTKEKQTDMSAGRFIDLSLAYFGQKNPVTTIVSVWSQESDNYYEFSKQLLANGNRDQAAFATWSGKKYLQLGFTEISFPDGTRGGIAVTFKKPAISATSPSTASKT